MHITDLCLFAAYAANAVHAAALTRRAAPPQCSNVVTPVSVTGTVRQFPANFNRSTFDYSTVPNLPTAQLSGKYQIAASYCEPGTIYSQARSNTLQILVHGQTYTRTYWSGLGHPPHSYAPTANSYIDYASDQGYPTLAIDRLCNGNSTHPSNDNACQVENQAAVVKALVDKAKSGFYGRSFTNVILVGHSFGSAVTQALSRIYPNEVDSIVLTGFAILSNQTLSTAVNAIMASTTQANQANPSKYGSLDANYFAITNETAFIDFLYAGSFNQTVAEHDFNTSGTTNFFEFSTVAVGQLVASNYTGDVIVLNGELDAPECGGNCGEGTTSLTQQAGTLFPKADEFFAYNTGNTGHDVNLHTSAPESYQVIFNELSQEGF